MWTIPKRPAHPQWLALAWLRETGEVRPTLDLLCSDEPLSPELRRALATWIKRGSKRRSGSSVPADPWKEYPPKLTQSMRLPTTRKQRQAMVLFAAYPVLQSETHRVMLRGEERRRGGQRTTESEAIKAVAANLKVSERTARIWFRRFFPQGY